MDMPLFGLLCWLCILGVLYSYVGYPLLLYLLTRIKSPIDYAIDSSFQPRVTLLIAAYNEASVIGHKLDNSLALNYPKEKLQILVAVDGHEDNTLEVVKSYQEQGVDCSFTSQRVGKMAAINRAMDMVSGEIIVFSDANNLYEANTLAELIAPFENTRWGAVSGAKHISDTRDALSASEGLYWRYESHIKVLETRLKTCTAVAGEILAIRRNLYTVPPANIINDDYFLAMNILAQGYHIFYQPRARSFEPTSQSSQAEISRRSRINAGRYQAMAMALTQQYLSWRRPLISWQIASHKFSRPLVPLAMILLLVANIGCLLWPYDADTLLLAVIGLASPLNWWLFVLQLVFYGLALLGLWTGKPTRKLGKLLYLSTFLLNSNIAALQGLFKFLSGKQTSLWRKVNR